MQVQFSIVQHTLAEIVIPGSTKCKNENVVFSELRNIIQTKQTLFQISLKHAKSRHVIVKG